jgi:hypothetical protein
MSIRRLSRGRRLSGVPLAAVVAGTAVIVLAGGGTALALTASSPARTAPPGSVYGCVSGSTRVLERVYTVAGNFPGCPAGSFAVTVESVAGPKGAAGAQGPAGAQGKTGPAGPAGPVGSAGASNVTSVTATTTVTDWPESSGWATDNFTRQLDVTVEGQVNNSHCGGAPVCYAVFGTITDNGTTTTVDGHASPNGSSTDLIKGAWTGTMQGNGTFQFYATSDKAAASNVPVSAAGTDKPATTTDWGELAFPAGAQFFGAELTAYDWDYVVPVTCGTDSAVTETWNDQINPGDDGQGASDGNIIGATQDTGGCPAS